MKKHLFIALVLFQITSALAQSGTIFKFKHIDDNAKLSNNWVRTIYQDKDDFIWFGTADGLNRYDGYECMVYRPATEKGLVFGNISINHISEKSDDELWISAANGIYILKENQIKRNTDFFPTSYNFVINENDSVCWVGGYNGLLKYNLKDKSIVDFSKKEQLPVYKKPINKAFKDSYGNIWFASTGVLFKYITTSKTFKKFSVFKGIYRKSKQDILAITEGKDKTIWIGFGQSGVFKMAAGDDEFYKFSNGPILDLHVDNDNLLWIARGSGLGLQIADLNLENPKKKIKTYKNNVSDPISISDDSAFKIFEDRSGDIWLGTFGAGVNYTSKRDKKIKNLIKNSNRKYALNSNLVNVILEDSTDLWIGTEGGLDRLQKSTGETVHYNYNPNNPNSISRDPIYSLNKDNFGNLWIGTWDGGLNSYNYKTNRFKRYYSKSESGDEIQNKNVLSILSDSKDRLWIGASPGGLYQYDYEKNKFKTYKDSTDNQLKAESNFINQIAETSDGLLMFNSYIGINFFDPKNETFTYNKIVLKNETITPNIICSYLDKSEKIWIGTNIGLLQFNRKTRKFIPYDSKGILDNISIFAIIQDDENNMWASTNKGLYTIDSATEKITKYTKQDGFTANDFKRRSVYKNKDGTLYFGTSKGLNFFNPKEITINKQKPTVAITSFKVLQSKPNENKKYRSILKNANTQDEITLSHNESNFVISFTGLNYLHSEKNKYQYKLEGYDKVWIDTQNSRSATYTNIDPGEYVFKVIASNNDGIWSDQEKNIKIVIKAAWYNSKLFKTILGILILILPLITYFIRASFYRKQRGLLKKQVAKRTRELTETNQLLQEKTSEIERKNKELSDHRNHLEELVKGRTTELQRAKLKAEESDRLKSAFVANLSHEIRTPMNAIHGFSSLLNEDDITKEERKEYVDIINSSCDTLLVLIDDILDISILDAQGIELKMTSINLYDFLKEIETIHKQKQKLKVEIYLDSESDRKINILTDIVRLKQVLSNLINNAIKFTEKGHVKFGYTTKKEIIIFYVEDTGIGIAQSDLDVIFNPFLKAANNKEKVYRGTGIGLSISEKIITRFGGKIWATSKIGIGSTFYIEIPLKINSLI